MNSSNAALDTQRIKERGLSRLEELCRYLLPGGRKDKDGARWRVGNISGDTGKSFDVNLTTGQFGDWASGDKMRNGAIDLWMDAKGVDFNTARTQLAQWLGIPIEPQKGYQQKKNGSKPFDWPGCVDAARSNTEKLLELENWRGLSHEFCEWLCTKKLLGLHRSTFGDECYAFPVYNNNIVAGPHFLETPPKGWRYSSGTSVTALVIGNLETAKEFHIHESTWDALAFCDRTGYHLRPDTCTIATRGSNHAKTLVGLIPASKKIYVWPQNDQPDPKTGKIPSEEWFNAVKETLERPFYRVQTPSEFEDINEWTIEGALKEDLLNAIKSASYSAEHKLSGRNVLDFLDVFIDPKTNLAGNRWLTQDGSAFVIAPSGHGKSSLAMQLTIYWSIGHVVFGIKPARPLRILIVQSEDDDAETKKFVQMIRKMNLNDEELRTLRDNTRFEFQRAITGEKFIKALDDWLTEWPADVLIINPLSGFLLCDLKDDEKVSLFLREKLSGVMEKHKCAPIVFHHTPKINFVKLDNMQWYDWMYAMSGCAGLTNWGRAVLVIAPSKVPGTYRFIAAKRFDEIQWTEREYWYSHSTEKIQIDGKESTLVQWVPSNSDQIKTAEPEPKAAKLKAVTTEIVLEKMSPIEWVTRQQFKEWARDTFKIGVNPASLMLTDMVGRGLVETQETPRSGTNPLILFRRKNTTT